MTRRALILALALSAPVGAHAATAARPGLTVWPARVRLAAGATTDVHVANGSRRTQILTLRISGYALDLRGSPRIVPSSPGTPLVAVRPARLVLPPGGAASFLVRAARPGRAAPGDHPALVLLTAQSAGGAGVGVRVRIGVAVEVRVPGAVHRRLRLGGLRLRRSRIFDLVVENAGNVAERVMPGSAMLQVLRRGRLLRSLRPRARELFPHTRGIVEFVSPRPLRGRLTVVAVVPRPGHLSRRFQVVA